MIHITYSNNPIIVVDGNELANRAYFGFSKDEDIKSPMTLGFLTMLNAVVHRIVWYAKVRNNELPLNIVLAFDGKNNVRKRWYPEYKAHRKVEINEDSTEKEKEQKVRLEAISAGLQDLHLLLPALGFQVATQEGWEADDICATVARKAEQVGRKAIILSSDKDCLQMVSDLVTVAQIKSGVKNIAWVTPDLLLETHSVSSEEYVSFAAMRGDVSDNLPGINGIGPKKASAIIRAGYKDLNMAIASDADLTKVVGEKLHDEIRSSVGVWERNVKMMTLNTDVDFNLLTPKHVAGARDLLEEREIDADHVEPMVHWLTKSVAEDDDAF